ncbi:MAG: ATP-binding protein [Bacteroidota bacterium]|nr:ATP-binding protein [Bacteroidota bacterium]
MENIKELLDENKRVNILREYQILDSPPEEAYDDIAQLAAEICQTKLAAITLIDEKRQWIKSQVGSELKLNNIPLSSSFCVHLLGNKDLVIVPDCAKDARFSENPIVKNGPKIAFYAGVPLVSPDGYMLGSICVLDVQQRELAPYQLNALKVLAKQVMKLLELSKINHELLSNRNRIETRYEELERFSYAISHDLRGPVKNISALIGLLNLQLKSGSEEDIKQYMIKIVKESDRMNKLVADLLEFSLYGKKQQVKEWFSVADILDDVKLSMEQKLRENNVMITYSETISRIYAVKSDITRLLQNLLENAVKFRKIGTPPKINVMCTEEKEYWKLSVQDNGIGISKEGSEKIFEVFSRLHSNERYQGTGIGLATCKRIAENHDGRIWVESAPNEGSTFYVLLKKNL